MTPSQKAKIEELRSEQVAFPPLFELGHGHIAVLLVDSYTSARHGEFPPEIDLRLVILDEGGEALRETEMTYVPRRRR